MRKYNLGPVPGQLLDAIKAKIELLFEAVQKDGVSELTHSVRTLVATGEDDEREVQVIVELQFKQSNFIEDGEIHYVDQRGYEERPYAEKKRL